MLNDDWKRYKINTYTEDIVVFGEEMIVSALGILTILDDDGQLKATFQSGTWKSCVEQ